MHPRRASRHRQAALIVVSALFALLPLAACGRQPAATATPGAGTPADAAATRERVPTAAGGALDGRLFAASGSRLVILLHEYDGDQRDWFPVAHDLARDGIASALTFDFSGYGASDGRRSTGEGLVTDAEAAVSFARGLGYRSIILCGAGMGATTALIVASGDPDIAGVVAISPAARFGGLDAVQAIRDHEPAMLLVAADGDVSARDSIRQLDAVADLPPQDVRILPGDAHGAAMFASDNAAALMAEARVQMDAMWAAR